MHVSPRFVRAVVITSAAAIAVAGLSACSSSKNKASSGSNKSDKKVFQIYLSNNFSGNDWRQQMEKTAQVIASHYYADKVKLTIVDSENDPTKQAQSLNNILLKKPDALLLDSASPTALNGTLARFAAAHIPVISFDQLVTSTSVKTVATDIRKDAQDTATFLFKSMNGKGNVLLDQGLSGAPLSQEVIDAFNEAKKAYPGIKVAGTYQSQYALAPEQQAATSLVAAHPKVDGIYSQGYGTPIEDALAAAGRSRVPMVSAAFNRSLLDCAKYKSAGQACGIYSDSPAMVGTALQVAVDTLEGKQTPQKTVFESHLFSNNAVTVDGATFVPIEMGKNALADAPLSVTLPVYPNFVGTTLDPKLVTG